jgi:hypothetical protein
MAKIKAEAYEGDYPDPRKSGAVDASYSDDYKARRNKFAKQMKDKMKRKEPS